MIRNNVWMTIFAMGLFLIAGCTVDSAQKQEGPLENAENGLILCTDPRPEICTMEYDPVCGLLNDGDQGEYANKCSACSDIQVEGYVPGPCT